MPGLICLREKLWTRTYSIGDQVPTCPVFTRAKIKPRSGIKVNLSRHNLLIFIATWSNPFIKMNKNLCFCEITDFQRFFVSSKSVTVLQYCIIYLNVNDSKQRHRIIILKCIMFSLLAKGSHFTRKRLVLDLQIKMKSNFFDVRFTDCCYGIFHIHFTKIACDDSVVTVTRLRQNSWHLCSDFRKGQEDDVSMQEKQLDIRRRFLEKSCQNLILLWM